MKKQPKKKTEVTPEVVTKAEAPPVVEAVVPATEPDPTAELTEGPTMEPPDPSWTLQEWKISADIDLPKAEKRLLPPPQIVSPVTFERGWWWVKIIDHLGRPWTLAVYKKWRTLRHKLTYFRTLTKETLVATFADIPRRDPWNVLGKYVCVACGEHPKCNPSQPDIAKCACGAEGSRSSELFKKVPKARPPLTEEQKAAKKAKAAAFALANPAAAKSQKEQARAAKKAKKAAKEPTAESLPAPPKEPAPLKNMSLMERMAARKTMKVESAAE